MIRVLCIFRGFGDYMVGFLNAIPSDFKIYCLVTEDDRSIEKYIENGNVEFLHLFPPRVRSIKNIIYLLKLLKIIQTIEPEIIHLQSGLIWELILLRFYRKSKIVLTLHDVTKHPSSNNKQTPQYFLNYAIKLADSYIVHGFELRDKLLGLGLGVEEKSVHVMPHGLITKYGLRPARTSYNANMLFFGTIDKWKGLEYLLESVKEIFSCIPNATLTIAGRVNDETVIKMKGLTDNPKIFAKFGFVDDNAVTALFDDADLLILPYIEASQSGVLNIAYSFSLPVVATNVGSLPEMIIDGETGYVIRPARSDDIARVVIDYFETEGKPEIMSRKIADVREELFGKTKKSGIIRNTYQSLLMRA